MGVDRASRLLPGVSGRKLYFPGLSFSGLSPLFLYVYHTFTALSHAFGGDYRFMLNIVACRKQPRKAVCTVQRAGISAGDSPAPEASVY